MPLRGPTGYPHSPAPIYTQGILGKVWEDLGMDRLEKLKVLENDLLEQMKIANSKSYAALAKQYRETLKEIDELESTGDSDDEIGEILAERKADGKSGAIR